MHIGHITMAAKHDAAYFAERRRAQGIPVRGDYDHLPRFIAAGKELQQLMSAPLPALQWPKDLFCVALQQQATRILADGDKCGWKGCNRPHGMNLPLPVRNPYGGGFSHNLYFCSDGCRSLHIRSKANG